MKASTVDVLFITWDGTEQDYLQSLFGPIFAALLEKGVRFHVIQFTTANDEAIRASREFCVNAGLQYKAITVWGWPKGLGRVGTLLWGIAKVRSYVKKNDIRWLMPRSLLPGLVALVVARICPSVKLIFDTDGLVADHRVDFGGMKPNGLLYRFLRDVEAQGLKVSSAVLTRTRASIPTLISRAGAGCDRKKFFVVPNGKDDLAFSPLASLDKDRVRRQLGWDKYTTVIIYVGTLGPAYCPREIFSFFQTFLHEEPGSFLQIVTGSTEVANMHLSDCGVPSEKVSILRAKPSEVPKYIAASDLGVSFREPRFSLQAAAPIKLSEYLLCGVPVITNKGIGDVEADLGNSGAAYFVDEFSNAAYAKALSWYRGILKVDGADSISERCRTKALDLYSMKRCVTAYNEALEFCFERKL